MTSSFSGLQLAGSLLFLVLLVAGATVYGRTVLGMWRNGTGRIQVEALGPPELVLALAYVGWFVLFTVGELLLQAERPAEVTGSLSHGALLFNLALTFGLLAVLIGVLRARGHRVLEFFGLRRYPAWKIVPAAIGWLLLAYPLIGLSVALVLGLSGLDPAPQPVLQFFLLAKNPWDKVLLAGMAVVVAPVFEELLFRGFLYPVFKRFLGAAAGAVLAAILFSMVHVYLPAVLAFFVLALCLTVAYERTGSVAVPIVMHMIFNGITLAAALLAPNGLPVPS